MTAAAKPSSTVRRATLWLAIAVLCALPATLLASWWSAHVEAAREAQLVALVSSPIREHNDAAVRELARAAAQRPWDWQVQYSLGARLAKLDRSEEAARVLVRAAALNPGSASARAALGVALARTGKPESAEAQLSAALKMNPRLQFAQAALGALLEQYQQWETAAGHLEAAARLKPDDLESRFLLATCYEHLYLEDKKLEVLQDLVKRSPNDTRFLKSLGYVDLFFGRFAEGEALYRRIIAMTPADPEAHYLLGRSLAEQANTPQQFADAERELKPVAAQSPDQPGVHVALGILYFRRADWPGAIAELETARRAGTTEMKTLLYLGQAELRAGRTAEGNRTLTQFQHMSWVNRTVSQQENRIYSLPEDTPAHRHEKDAVRMRLARVYMDDGQYGNALRHLQAVHRDEPADATVTAMANECGKHLHLTAAAPPQRGGV